MENLTCIPLHIIQFISYPDGTVSDGRVAFSRLPPSCRYRAEEGGGFRVAIPQIKSQPVISIAHVKLFYPSTHLKKPSAPLRCLSVRTLCCSIPLKKVWERKAVEGKIEIQERAVAELNEGHVHLRCG